MLVIRSRGDKDMDGQSTVIFFPRNGEPPSPLRISRGVLRLPVPRITTHGPQITRCSPSQQPSGQRRVCVATGGIAGAVAGAIVRGAGTLGASYRLGRTTVDLTYAHTFAQSLTAGATSGVASEYANSTSRLAENTVSFGLGLRF